MCHGNDILQGAFHPSHKNAEKTTVISQALASGQPTLHMRLDTSYINSLLYALGSRVITFARVDYKIAATQLTKGGCVDTLYKVQS